MMTHIRKWHTTLGGGEARITAFNVPRERVIIHDEHLTYPDLSALSTSLHI
jgi:hypothetical protein